MHPYLNFTSKIIVTDKEKERERERRVRVTLKNWEMENVFV